MIKFMVEFWHDLKTANQRNANLRRGQVAAIVAALCLLFTFLSWIIGDDGFEASLTAAGMFGAVSLLSFLLQGFAKLMRRRDYAKQCEAYAKRR